jgi:PhzF family phenazine biosynthesis protein
MTQKIVTVDAFTARAFAGNPAAVCVMDGAAPEDRMRDIAREMNLAETAFLYPENDGYRLRWFTPTVEIALCGHATVASAHVLWQDGHLPEGRQARFYTMSGLLTADRDGDWIRLDFPSNPPTQCAPPEGLLDALGIDRAEYVGKNKFDYFVVVSSEDVVRGVDPDFTYLAKVDARGVIITARSKSPEYDFVSRFFAPAVGVNEDPVTGSAHTCLTPYWSEKLGKTEMVAYQASARGGVVKVVNRGERVWLSGQAVTVLRGELLA